MSEVGTLHDVYVGEKTGQYSRPRHLLTSGGLGLDPRCSGCNPDGYLETRARLTRSSRDHLAPIIGYEVTSEPRGHGHAGPFLKFADALEVALEDWVGSRHREAIREVPVNPGDRVFDLFNRVWVTVGIPIEEGGR